MHHLPVGQQGASRDRGWRRRRSSPSPTAGNRSTSACATASRKRRASSGPTAGAPTSPASMASSAELSTSFGSNAERVRALSNRSSPSNLPVEQEERTHLGRDGARRRAVVVEAGAVGLVEGGGGLRARVGCHALGLGRDVGPHLALVTASRARGAQRCTHLGGLLRAAGRVVGAPGAGELRRLGMPAPGLHAGDGNHDGLVGGRQHTEIQNPVLLGPDQFLAVEQQDRLRAVVDEPQLRNAACLRNLGDAGTAALEGLVEQQVGWLGDAVPKQAGRG